MPYFIISSHGEKLDQLFLLPRNCTLHFYCNINQVLYNNIAYPVFNDLIQQRTPQVNIVQTINGGNLTRDYLLQNGGWAPYYLNRKQEVNGLFSIPSISPINELDNATLSDIVDTYYDRNAPLNIFYCLFCRT